MLPLNRVPIQKPLKSMKHLIPFILLLFLHACGPDTDASLERVPSDALEVKPLLVGMEVPDVEFRDINDKTVELRKEIEKKPTAIIYYRGGWCPYCSKHLSELKDIEDELYDLGIRILAISPDTPRFLSETLAEHQIGYRLLSDATMEGAKKFGIAYRVQQETVKRYKENGMDLNMRSGYNHNLLPVPSVFLADTDGSIFFQYVNPDYKVRISSNLLYAAAKELAERHKLKQASMID